MNRDPWPINTNILAEHDPVSLSSTYFQDTDVVAGAEAILRSQLEPRWKKQARKWGNMLLENSAYIPGPGGFIYVAKVATPATQPDNAPEDY